MLDADLVWIVRTISEEYATLDAAEVSKDANEAMKGIHRCR